MPNHESLLDEELAFFKEKLRDMVEQNEGRFALIKGHSLAGAYSHQGEAIQKGYEMFGDVPFLVKEIARAESPAHP